MNYMQKKVT